MDWLRNISATYCFIFEVLHCGGLRIEPYLDILYSAAPNLVAISIFFYTPIVGVSTRMVQITWNGVNDSLGVCAWQRITACS